MGRGEANSKKHISSDEWGRKLSRVKVNKEDLNNLIMNFLVTEGYVDAAKAFEKESGTSPGVDLNAITDRMEIRKAVQSGQVEEAIERTNDLDPEILEEQPRLFFRLQQQRMIELVRGGRVEEALEFAQEFLAPCGEDNQALLEELERTVSLLVFEDVGGSPVADLLEPAQRQKAASELNAAILCSQSQDQEPKLPGLLKLMHWLQQALARRADFPSIVDLSSAELEPPDGGNGQGGDA